jgi:replication factor A1
MKISDLKPGTRSVNITVKIEEIEPAREVQSRSGEQLRVANAVASDDSGKIKMSLWNEDIDRVKANDTVTIDNGYVSSFRGEIQLSVGRYGKLTVQPQA